MENEVVVTLDDIFTQIDTITTNLPQVSGESFRHTFALAKAITDMELLFENPDIKATVLAMRGSPLGFLTDKDYGEPYAWPIVKRAAIQAMLEKYRLSGNEWNLIGSRFMPVKCGKFRHIIEFPGLSNFDPTTTSATFVFEERADKYGKKVEICTAKVKCFATWLVDGKKYSIGFGDDQLVFKIRVNKGMGDDAVIGKALSKLFGRVLMRLMGVSIPEVDDIDGLVSDDDVPENLKSSNPESLPERKPREKEPESSVEESPPTGNQTPDTEPPQPEFVPPKVCGHTGCAAYTETLASHCDNPSFHDKDDPGKACFLFENSVSSACPDTEFCVLGINNLLAGMKSQIPEAKAALGITTEVRSQYDKWRLYYWIHKIEFPIEDA